MQPAVTARNLTLAYGSRVALADASFVLPVGVSVALIGPNGSGKSSLLRAIAGLLTPRSGSLEVPAAQRRGGVSLVLQTTDVDRSLPLTVGEAVAMARYPHRGVLGRMTRADRDAVDGSLERLEIADLRRRQLSELSGGQRQRVLVAQGLAQEAELVLLDEPVTALDAVSHTLIDAAIDAERDAGRTVVTSTHDLADARRADLVLLLAGRVVAAGRPDEVLTEVGLGDAYGGRLVAMGDNILLLDDPHHHHDHG